MSIFAYVVAGSINRYGDFEVAPELSAGKGAWLPVVEDVAPTYESRISTCTRQVQVTETQVTVTWLVENKPLDQVKQELIAISKDQASKNILSSTPDYTQRNLLARTSELHDIVLFGGTLTTEQETELQTNRDTWAAIKAVRTAQNIVETNVLAATTVQEALAAFEV
jgi:hypothetical protein